VAELDAKYRPHLEPALESGEELSGICVASQQKGLFKGGAVVIGTTDRRLLFQPLDRRGNPDGPVQPISPEQVAAAKAGPAGGGWINVDSAILDHAAVRLQIETTAGEKLKLMLMRGEGKLLGGLGGGETQRRGLEALASWFSRLPPR
jgi:hypothetical protein